MTDKELRELDCWIAEQTANLPSLCDAKLNWLIANAKNKDVAMQELSCKLDAIMAQLEALRAAPAITDHAAITSKENHI